jgi:hypothetical protein
MVLKMADLQQYVDAVLADEDEVLLSEASDCLAAGAHRAAYITVWLAAAESLRRKFVEASVRDNRAAVILGQIQEREAQHKAVDGLLIDKAKEYGFITDAERTRLRHLYENRNVFGHPYEQRPSEQLVETAASEAVDIVLGRPVALREGYLSNQVQRLTTDPAFLSDDEAAVTTYAEAVHARSAADLRVWFMRKMWRELDGVFADPSLDGLQRRAVWFMRRFLLHDTSIFGDWDAVDDLPDHRKVIVGVLADEQLFPHLSAHAQDIVTNVLLEQAAGDPTFLVLLFDLAEANVLSEAQRRTMDDFIAGFPLSRLAASGLPLRAYANRVVETLRIKTWDVQNTAIPPLRNAGSAGLAELDPDTQEEVGRNVMQAAEGNAFSAVNFLSEVSLGEETWPLPFVRGLASEPFFSEEGVLRFKPRQTLAAVRSLRNTPQDDRDGIVDHLVSAISSGTPRQPWSFRHERAEVIETLRQLATSEELSRVGEIADAIEAVEAEDPA